MILIHNEFRSVQNLFFRKYLMFTYIFRGCVHRDGRGQEHNQVSPEPETQNRKRRKDKLRQIKDYSDKRETNKNL